MQYEDLNDYINSIYKTYPIVSAEEFIRSTGIEDFCPVIETPVAMFMKMILEMKRP